MKKIAFTLILSLMATFAFAQTVPNGDFELWSVTDVADNWTTDTAGGIDDFQESATVHGGSYSARLVINTGTQGNCDYESDFITGITPGVNYTASGYVYDNDAAGRLTIVTDWFDSSDGYLSSNWSGIYSSDGTTWEELSDTNTAPASAAKAKVRFRGYDVSGDWDGDAEFYLDDVTFSAPSGAPSLTDAFSSSSLVMKVQFDQDVDQTTAENTANYTMSGVTFSDAEIDAFDNSIVWLSSSSAITGDATSDTLTVDNVQASGGGTGCSGETANFFAGITPISIINQNDASFDDDNLKVTVKGIVSANDNYNNVWIQDGTGTESGILIFDYSFDGDVSVGDEVTVCCTGDVYYNMMELKNPIICSGPNASSPYSPIAVTAADIETNTPADSNPAELYEGCLVRVSNVTVGPSWDFSSDYDFDAEDGSDLINVDDDVWYQFGGTVPVVGGATYNITGVVTYTYGQYRISPRDASDIDLVVVPVELSVFSVE